MNILYIAYSCSPYHGSEDKIGWNVPVECAKTNNVFVITKEEQREYTENYLKNKPVENIRFYYVDIPEIYKKIFAGQMYSGRLNIWNRRAFHIAKAICEKEKIDVIHQITPIEFRSIGDYGKIPAVKFVCGPIGGGVHIPRALYGYVKGHGMVEAIRTAANWWHKQLFRITGKMKRIDDLLFVNRETADYLKDLLPKNQKQTIHTDIGIDTAELAGKRLGGRSGKCRFLVAGRLIYIKGHAFLLDALKRIPEGLDYECRIVGAGPERDKLQAKVQADAVLRERVVFTGAVAYQQMEQEYEQADVLILPSFREATGTVLLEAMSKGIPAITIGKFGGAELLDENSGWLYDGTDEESYIENLKNAVAECIQNLEEVKRRGINARKAAENYTWERKAEVYLNWYTALIQKK